MINLAAQGKENVVELFNRLLIPSPDNGDTPLIADLASAIIPKILASENYDNIQALKERAGEVVMETGPYLSDVLRKSIEIIFIACVDRLSVLSKQIKAVTSPARIVPPLQPSPRVEFHPRKDSGSDEVETVAVEPLSHWLEVTVPN